MPGKSRASRWRDALVANGGKAVGVTLTPGAAVALETLQVRFKLSQRDAISRALEYAAARMGHAPGESGSGTDHAGRSGQDDLGSRLVDLERRVQALEGGFGATGESAPHEVVSGRDGASGLSGEALDRLVDFSARLMWEHGERVSRAKLYELARQEGVPIHDNMPEYGTFLSLNMDRIRERMKLFK